MQKEGSHSYRYDTFTARQLEWPHDWSALSRAERVTRKLAFLLSDHDLARELMPCLQSIAMPGMVRRGIISSEQSIEVLALGNTAISAGITPSRQHAIQEEALAMVGKDSDFGGR